MKITDDFDPTSTQARMSHDQVRAMVRESVHLILAVLRDHIPEAARRDATDQLYRMFIESGIVMLNGAEYRAYQELKRTMLEQAIPLTMKEPGQ